MSKKAIQIANRRFCDLAYHASTNDWAELVIEAEQAAREDGFKINSVGYWVAAYDHLKWTLSANGINPSV